MTTHPSGAVLHASRATQPLTAAAAVAWFADTAAPGEDVIGYVLSPRAALWFRVLPDDTLEWGTAGGDPLAEAYELVSFDGDRELRWLRAPDGRGAAVALGENLAALPEGDDVTAKPWHHRGDRQPRLLAGTAVAHQKPGWTTLRGGRRPPAHLPCQVDVGDTLMVESVEYLVADDHGNLDVADTRMVALRPATFEAERGRRESTSERTRQ